MTRAEARALRDAQGAGTTPPAAPPLEPAPIDVPDAATRVLETPSVPTRPGVTAPADADVDALLAPLRTDDPAPAERQTPAKRRRRVTVTGVIGELLITFGVVVLLYVAWQLWIGDWIYSAQHNAEGAKVSEQWQADFDAGDLSIPAPVKQPDSEHWDPPVLPEPADTQEFAQMRIPRFGADYSVAMAGGVTRSGTLDPIGIGHYPGTAMPGQVGNFALAAHRTTWGKPFNRIADLRLDDPIVVETPEGWYTYRFRTLQYVVPSQVDVLLDVPQAPDVPPGGRYITLTSCSPMYSLAERIVAYGVFDSFQPRSEGAPAWLTEGVS